MLEGPSRGKKITISIEILKTVPYINQSIFNQNEDRLIPFHPFYSGHDWSIPFPVEGKIIFISGTPASSLYISENIVDSKNDIYIPCIDFLQRYMSWIDLSYHINGLKNDFENLFVIINKIDLYHTFQDKEHGKSDFVRTEIEYLFIICKSIYDILQKIISIFWNTKIELIDKGNKVNLPDNFRNVIITDRKKRSFEEIQRRYNLPKELAEYYYNQIDFYEKLKIIRDDIVHHEKTIDYLYVLEDGFAISKNTKLYKEYTVWKEMDKKEHDLYSLRPFLSYLINSTIRSCNQYCDCIYKIIRFPDSIIDNKYKFFLRTPHINSFIKMEDELTKSSWWNTVPIAF